MKKKDYVNILIIFGLCLGIIFLVTGLSNLFGSDTDWVNQHTVFPEYFRNNFYETGDLFPNFSFNYGGGQNIYNISYYGYLSPIILPSYLMPHISMTTYIIVVNILIVLLSAFLFYKWLFNNKNDSNICFVATTLFSLSAALIFHMHRHMMFVNYMPFLIMSLIGVDKLLEKNKKSYFVLSVFLMIMTSYYFSVSGIAVIGCYFIYKYLKIHKKFEIKDFTKETIKIILLGVLAIALAAILLLPTFHVLFSGRTNLEESVNFISLFIPSFKTHVVLDNTYGIGYSLIGMAAFIYLLFTKKKENIFLGVILLLIVIFPFFRYLLNAGLYLKEKCLIPFATLTGLAVAIFLTDLFNKKIKIKKFNIFIFLIGLVLIFANNFRTEYFYMFVLILLIMYYSKYKNGRIFSLAIIVIAFFTCLANNLSKDFVSYETYDKYFNQEYNDAIDNILANDSSYFRISNLMYPVKNVNKIYNQREFTTGIYTSSYNNYYLDFVRKTFKINNPDFNYFFISSSDNILFDKFMGVKYIYSTYNIGREYEKIGNNIYKNNNVLPIFYHSSKLMSNTYYDNLSYPSNVIALLNNSVVNENVDFNYDISYEKVMLDYILKDVNKDEVEIKQVGNEISLNVYKNTSFSLKLKEKIDKILFINFVNLDKSKCSIGNGYIKINNITNLITCKTWEYPNYNEEFHYVLSMDGSDELHIEIGKGNYKISNIETFIYDDNKLLDFIPFNIESIKNDTIKGNIEVLEDGYFITSIPYDQGFKIKANNEEKKPEIVNKAFLGFKLNKGTYEIEISYTSPLFKEGKIISLISLSIFVAIILFDLRKNSRKKI